MLLDHSYGQAVESLKVWWPEIVLCTTRTGALPCLSLPMDAGQTSSTFITPRMGQVWHRFWPGLPVVAMAQETGIEAKPVLPALTLCSSGLPDRDIPHLFSATVERDETYSGGQWKNKKHCLKMV
ncbi:TPA: hypothetical protein EYO63_07775 [Candidatus Poribacteria bacterium]|nr:hypothetical protein [Candidatus Poribacteria bacterium]